MIRFLLFSLVPSLFNCVVSAQVKWEHISSKTGAIEVPNKGKQQTSAAVADFDGDSTPDLVFWAQGDQTLYFSRSAAGQLVDGGRPEIVLVVGDGKGNFPRDMIISEGIDLHDSEIVDLDGDDDLDILGKAYDGDAPRLDIWLQNGTGKKPGQLLK